MSLPRAVAALAAQHGAGTWAGQGAGLPIYIGEQPQAGDSITLYIEPDGLQPDVDLDDDPADRTCDARFLVRHSGDSTGRTAPGQAAAQHIIDRLHGLAHASATDTRTGTVIHVTQALARNSAPTPLGPDPDGRHEWTVVLSLTYEPME